MAKQSDQFVPEHFLGEQSVVMHLCGKGLVVLTGCSHCGVMNIIKHAQRMTGIESIYAVIGGLHLTCAKPELIARTVADMKATRLPTSCRLIARDLRPLASLPARCPSSSS